MKNKFNIVFTAVIIFYTTTDSNGMENSNNPPSPLYYFNLTHDLVSEELTNTIKNFDKAINGNIIDIVQNTINRLDNICENINSNNNDLIEQINKYTKVIRTLYKNLQKIIQPLNIDVRKKLYSSINECLSSCKGILKVIENKPATPLRNYISILDVLKNKK